MTPGLTTVLLFSSLPSRLKKQPRSPPPFSFRYLAQGFSHAKKTGTRLSKTNDTLPHHTY